MSVNRKYIETIITANNDNSLAIFVGAGVSKSSETKTFKLPTWQDLIDSLKDDLNAPDETDFLRIAQLYHLAFGEHTYYKKLKKYFPDNITPSIIHKQIFEINPHVVITTNWDSILEKAIEENAYIYDLVCSDTDLVKSTLQNKLIKMHGDFKHHNLVFKEDDYINYQLHFPLIENYIKSIISTHTVLFLGYSYSDLDLKQIVKWVQHHALNVRPPMYLVAIKRDPTQIKYLENHGITTIVIEDKDIDDDIDHDPGFSDYSKKIHTFLTNIRHHNKKDILNNNTQLTKFVLSTIEPLNQLNGILIEQVQRALSNCGFVFDNDSKPILEFYGERLTYDLDKTTRTIHARFIEILKSIDTGERPSPDVLKIFEILSKARIKGIILSSNDIKTEVKEYIPFAQYNISGAQSEENSLYDFGYKTNNNVYQIEDLFDSVFNYYNLGKLEDAFSLIEDAIAACLKRRNYVWLFIAMYNRNVLLDNLKFYSFKKENIERYSQYKKYDLKERYHNLTKDLRATLEPVYEFVNFTFVYRYAYQVSKDLKKTEDNKNTVENGGIVINRDVDQFSTKHENLISFVLKNRILIEDYEEYKSINKAFVKIALMRQILNDKVLLTKAELYSCIRYIKHKELRSLFEDLFQEESTHKGKFQIADDLRDWLINTVLGNVTNQYLQDRDEFRRFEYYLENIIFLLSLSKHDDKYLDKIMHQISRVVKEGRNTIGIFQSINLFFGIQHSLFKQEIKDKILTELIETLISKFVYGQFNGHEFFAITRNDLSNLYGYAQVQKVIISNQDLIDKLLSRIGEYSVSDKIDITQSFLLSIYDISTQPIQDAIRSFALSINNNIESGEEEYKKFVFELTLVIRNFKELSDDLVVNLDKYLEQYKTGTIFSSILYILGDQLNYLVNQKSLTKLKGLLDIINNSIARHEERDKLGFF